MARRRLPTILCLVVLLPPLAGACSLIPAAGAADLAPTLSFQDVQGGPVAFQSGQPVPTFDRQPRLRADLGGAWRFDAEPVDTRLSLTDRRVVINEIDAEAGRRADPAYDDSGWSPIQVPGTFNQPPNRSTTGGFYRRNFYVGQDWNGKYAMLKFGAVRYVADVWLNGQYLGYHEGGDTPFALDATQALLAPGTNALLVRVDNPIDLGSLNRDTVIRVAAPFSIRSPDLWSPGLPALYVLGVTVESDSLPVDELYTSFGLRQVKVDSTAPRILLNGDLIAFNGVAPHRDRAHPISHRRPAAGP